MYKEKKTKCLIILKRIQAQDYKTSSTKMHMTPRQRQLKEQIIRSYFKQSTLRHYNTWKGISLYLNSKEKPISQKEKDNFSPF